MVRTTQISRELVPVESRITMWHVREREGLYFRYSPTNEKVLTDTFSFSSQYLEYLFQCFDEGLLYIRPFASKALGYDH